jgi:hypothetical protein
LAGKRKAAEIAAPIDASNSMADLERAARFAAYLTHFQQAMLDCILQPVFQFPAFKVETEYLDECFITEHSYRNLNSKQKEKFNGQLRQAVVLELFGACGYESHQVKQDNVKYRIFTWDGCYAAKTAYRFASVQKSPIQLIDAPNTEHSKRYEKIQCPTQLKKLLQTISMETKEQRKQMKFNNIPNFQFLTENDLISRLQDDRFFFPFATLLYDAEMMPELFTVVKVRGAERISYTTCPHLKLTEKAKKYILKIHMWLVNAYSLGKLQVSRLN